MVFNKMKYYKNVKAIRKVFGTSIKWLLEYIISEKSKVQKNSLLSKKNKGNYMCVYISISTYTYHKTNPIHKNGKNALQIDTSKYKFLSNTFWSHVKRV